MTLAVTQGEEISISIYFPGRVATPTLHELALKRAVVSQHGDHTREEKIEASAVSRSSIAVSAVLVPSQRSQRLIVAFGDSVTDGDRSTFDADRNWPSDLIRPLGKTHEGSQVAVVNQALRATGCCATGRRLPSVISVSAAWLVSTAHWPCLG